MYSSVHVGMYSSVHVHVHACTCNTLRKAAHDTTVKQEVHVHIHGGEAHIMFFDDHVHFIYFATVLTWQHMDDFKISFIPA